MISAVEAESFLTEVLPQTGELAMGVFNCQDIEEIAKGLDGLDFSTTADIDIDTFLIDSICNHFPRANFLTEETASKIVDDAYYRGLEDLFVIDPIDGTANFSRSNPNFGISVALVKQGVTQFGAIHVPARGITVTASVDSPDIKVNGEVSDWHCSDTDNLKQATVLTDMPHAPSLKPFVGAWIGRLSDKVRRLGMEGSAVADALKLAEGTIDAFIHPGLLPWDVAASNLILQKAGVVITKSNGGEWDIFSPDIVASNPHIHESLVNSLSPIAYD